MALRFLRAIREDQRQRRADLRRPFGADLGLYAVNRLVRPFDDRRTRRLARSLGTAKQEALRIVFLVGVPRSGSTLLAQLMAKFLDIGYVSNLAARFWMAPLLGLDAQSWLNRMGGRRRKLSVQSDHGRTDGLLEPHEFGWFWRRHLDLGRFDDLRQDRPSAAAADGLQDEIFAMAVRSGGSFWFKNLNAVSYQIRWLQSVLPGARFVWMRRDSRAVAGSILRARYRHYGRPDLWWSTRPRDVQTWAARPWPDQIAHQISDVEAAVSEQLAGMPAEHYLELRYEDLVESPGACLRSIAGLSGTALLPATDEELSELTLCPSERRPANSDDDRRLAEALSNVSLPPYGS